MPKPTHSSEENGGESRRTGGRSFDTGNGGLPPSNQESRETTGRYLVLMRKDALSAGVRTLTEVAGLQVAAASDFESGAVDADTLANAEAVVFDTLAVAVVNTPPDQLQALSAAASDDSGILLVEEERVVYALAEGWSSSSLVAEAAPPSLVNGSSMTPDLRRSLELYRAAVNNMADTVLNGGRTAPGAVLETVEPSAIDESQFTWGLQVTGVARSRYSGQGIKVAVLDTGLDLGHPDFAGRNITSQSFIAGQAVQDGHGHGTHCIGTACGPQRPGQPPRYGVAYNAHIFAGKVLSNAGSGSDSGILAGIEWAIRNNCDIISMSLGAPTQPGQAFSQIFELVAQRALAEGTLIVAAAGNESNRPGTIRPVGHPANCPSIIAVGATDQAGQIALFSSAGLNASGGEVNIAGPGVNVLSSWPRPILYRRLNGTSMATPHVAGIAALYAEANPGMRGAGLGWLLLTRAVRRSGWLSRDVGAGLVQAP